MKIALSSDESDHDNEHLIHEINKEQCFSTDSSTTMTVEKSEADALDL
jgi:hypothetical protein